MPNVLIRDVPEDELESIRSAAAQRGETLQSFLLETVHSRAVHLRRQAALARISDRLSGKAETRAEDRDAVLDAVDAANNERAAHLADTFRA